MIMKKTMLLVCFLLFGLAGSHLHAQMQPQSLKNTDWKTYIGDPLYDTLTLHIRTDSSFVTDKSGNTVVRSVCKVSADTLTLTDYDGQYACPNATGKYKISITADAMLLTLIDDPCEGRGNSLNGIKWTKVVQKAP
jgi:hypothetical protein